MNENRDLNQRENGINPSELSGKGDYYFSNGVQERTPRTTPVGTKRKPAKKGNGVKSTYVFFIVEIQTDGILHRALAEGKALYLPRCLDDAGQMAFYRVQALEELESGSFGVREPSLAAPQYNMDLDGQALCLVPGLCFDNKGYRLGYGKGYYDRFLAKFRGVTLGLCYNDFLQRRKVHLCVLYCGDCGVHGTVCVRRVLYE